MRAEAVITKYEQNRRYTSKTIKVSITFIPIDPYRSDFAYRNITVKPPPEAPSASAYKGSTSQKPGNFQEKRDRSY